MFNHAVVKNYLILNTSVKLIFTDYIFCNKFILGRPGRRKTHLVIYFQLFKGHQWFLYVSAHFTLKNSVLLPQTAFTDLIMILTINSHYSLNSLWSS